MTEQANVVWIDERRGYIYGCCGEPLNFHADWCHG